MRKPIINGWVVLLIVFIIFGATRAFACSDNNNFVVGSTMDICTGACVYENESNLGTYVSCDSTVTCGLTIYSSNNTLVAFNQLMSRTSNYFNYTTSLAQGTYTGIINCNRAKGFTAQAFTITVSAAQPVGGATGTGSGSGVIGDNNVVVTEAPVVPQMPKPSFFRPALDVIDGVANKIYSGNVVIGRLIMLGVLLILIFWRKILKFFSGSKEQRVNKVNIWEVK